MYARILVPFDGSPTSEAGLTEALKLAATMESRLVALAVSTGFVGAVEMAAARAYDESAAAPLAECARLVEHAAARAAQARIACEKVVVDSQGRPVAQVILEEARMQRCDLIVMGTHGRRGLSRLVLGSDAEAVLRHTSVPVVMVRLGASH